MPAPQDSRLPIADINRWLALPGRQIVPHFPPALERVYTAESQDERLRAMRLGTLTGTLSGPILAALIWPIMTDAHDAILHVWLGFAVPLGLACHLILWLKRLPVAAQEWQVAAAGLGVGACLTHIMVLSRFAPVSFYFGGMMVLVMLDCAAARLRFLPCVAVVGGLAAMFAGGVPRMQRAASAPEHSSAVVIVLLVMCVFYALYGTWRLETEIRRSYALAARERYERSLLSVRNEELGQLLGDDALTGLANRRAFDAILADAWDTARASASSLSLIMLDVDSFKAFNDTYGHPAGDRCLRRIALCLREEMRGTTEVVARLGGEEFAVLLPLGNHALAMDAAERLRWAVQAVAMPHVAAAMGIVTVSAGVATVYAEQAGTAAQLVEAADQALYAAKRAGRNRVEAAAAKARASAST